MTLADPIATRSTNNWLTLEVEESDLSSSMKRIKRDHIFKPQSMEPKNHLQSSIGIHCRKLHSVLLFYLESFLF